MATVTSGAAYQRLQVPQDNIDQSIQFWGGQELKKQADKKLADEREKVRKDERFDDLFDKLNGLPEYMITGNQTEDDIMKFYAQDYKDKYTDIQNKMLEARENQDTKEYARLFTIAKTMEGEIANTNKYLASAKEALDTYAKNIDQYNEYDKDGYKIFDALSNNRAIIYTDEKTGKPRVAIQTDANIDENKDGVISEEERQNAVSLVKSSPKSFNIIDVDPTTLPQSINGHFKKIDILGEKGLVQQIAANIGKVSIEDIKGLTKITESGWQPFGITEEQKQAREEALEGYATSAISDPATFASIYNYGLNKYDNPREAFKKEENIKEAKEFLKNKVKEFFGFKREEETDAQQAAIVRTSISNKKNDTQPVGLTPVKVGGVWSQQLKQLYPNTFSQAGVIKTYNIANNAVDAPRGFIQNMPQAGLLSLTIDSNNIIYGRFTMPVDESLNVKEGIETSGGLIASSNTASGGKESTTQKRKKSNILVPRPLTDTELLSVANGLGYRDADSLIRALSGNNSSTSSGGVSDEELSNLVKDAANKKQ